MIDFYLNGERRRCSDVPADTSLLELLRVHLGRTGTKEGCASGDCGACTVAIGEPDALGELAYRNANACILPAHQIDGCHLVTVEGLARGDELHPAQAAMVDHHGSQCGFCTPGIVMSLFTLHEQQRRTPAPLTQERLEAALGGNLCRCTGYRPIRDAALSMGDYPDVRPAWADEPHLSSNVAWLRRPDGGEPATAGHYVAPQDITALRDLKRRRPKARLVAGGTDLWLETTQQLKPFDDIIDVRQVAELTSIDETQDGWWIGAAVTLSDMTPLLAEHYPAFEHLMHRFASSQIRNRGTLGGNIANASPIGDTPPVMLALDARLRLDGPDGARELPLSEFFLDYRKTALGENEFIAAIFLPRPTPAQQLKVWKLSKRREDDISAVLAAFAWRLEGGVMRDVRLGFGGMAAIPKRATETEAALEGCTPDPAVFAAARAVLGEELTPMSDVRGSAEYRRTAAGNMLERLRLMIEADRPAAEATPNHDIDNNDSATKVTLDAYAH
ncbi:xanthine dehydrogenase small subunit [Halomonas sp. I1]|uniref:xanthine dehydrogenase small subunit n=1 Tax=Halomonas sp. I1 TaxID=393536 RepID=UPI0028DD689D|nr:xanthine dehydrogenase small subunit [Halomonas sp. I1]MDT8893828.1 xanthine dehydrogenase small subunit [Halomonas sp. I1]